MKRILLLIDSLESGGAQRQFVGLAKGLLEAGYAVKALYYHPLEFYLQDLLDAGVEYEYIAGGENKIRRLRMLSAAIMRFAPDVVIAYLDMPCVSACLIKFLTFARWKLIVSERNSTQRLGRRDKMKFSFFKVADAIVPNSHTQGRFVAGRYPRLAGKIDVITNFTDTDRFRPDKKNREGIEARIISVGRVVPQKNVLTFIEAMRILRNDGFKFKIDWYGSRSLEPYSSLCTEAISEAGLSQDFEFHDAIANIADEYARSDIFVLPSIYEGFPNVLCEAMSSGLPVACGDVCDNAEIVENGKSGYLFDPHDAASIASAIAALLRADRETRREMGHFNREWAGRNFTQKVFIDKYVRLIEKL